MVKKFWAALGAVALVAQPAAAQEVPSPLKVLVENADEDSHACGITNDLMTAAVRAALRYNRITEDRGEGFGNPLAYLAVTTMRQGGLCISSANFQIKVYEYAAVQGMSKRVYADVVYCDKGTMLSGDDHGPRVAQAIKNLVDGCLNKMMLES